MKKLSRIEIQEEIYKILFDFSQYCEQYGLKYYLFYGTLLGAVRHKGFIPWDDDVDVIMKRDEYDRLQALMEKHPMGEKYELISVENGKCVHPYAKIINKHTVVRQKLANSDEHLWIDIFPMDNCPADKKEERRAIRKTYRYILLQNSSIAKMFTGTTALIAVVKMPVMLYAHLMGTKYFLRKMVKHAKKYPYSGKYMNLAAGTEMDCAVYEEDLADPEWVEFHGKKFLTVRRANDYLSKLYGDYMKLPPENKRYGHMMDAYLIEDHDEK